MKVFTDGEFFYFMVGVGVIVLRIDNLCVSDVVSSIERDASGYFIVDKDVVPTSVVIVNY